MSGPVTLPLSVYVHLPWCVRKCPYCDFNSHELKGGLPQHEYLAAIASDLELDARQIGDRSVQSIFIGGGTPSLFDADSVHELLQLIGSHCNLQTDAEITLEANPGTIEHGDFSALCEAGVNRVSLGVQSFDPKLLHDIGRIHDGDEARSAIEQASGSGFDSFNIDLMFGLPGQTVEQAMFDLELALSLGAKHLSWYQLTLEPNTRFHAFPPVLPDETVIEEIQNTGSEKLIVAGFEQYEVSAWVRDNFYCRHNLNYWQFGDYLGVGAGAHGKTTDLDTGAITRTVKLRHPNEYMQGLAKNQSVCTESHPKQDDTVFEFMLNGLRLTNGFDLALFEARTGQSREVIGARLAVLAEQGLLESNATQVRLTPQGKRFLNDVVAAFLPA